MPTESSSKPQARQRVVSGMRPTGALHLGHFHGVLKNWVRLQTIHDCFFFVADWHALTTQYRDKQDRSQIEGNVYDMVIDWLAAGVDPEKATLFIQSRMPEHAELFTLLAMSTPTAWLKRRRPRSSTAGGKSRAAASACPARAATAASPKTRGSFR